MWSALLLLIAARPTFAAILTPQTPRWRRARRRYWLATALGIAIFATTIITIKLVGSAFFLGPAAGWLTVLFMNVLAIAVWTYAANEVRCARSEWRLGDRPHDTIEVRIRTVLQTPVGRVRAAGLVEGISALVLFFVAMPLKYGPEPASELAATGKQAVFWVGSIHGGLFVFYALITFVAWGQGALRVKHVAMAAVASIVPFGPFVIDRVLKRHEEAVAKPAAPEEAW